MKNPWIRNLLAIVVILAGAITAGAQTQVSVSGSRLPPNTTLQNAIASNTNGTVLTVDTYVGVRVSINCSSGSSITVNFEAQSDGVNFASIWGVQSAGTVGATTVVCAGPAISNWYVPTGGYRQFRARTSGYTSGTVTVIGTPVPLNAAPPLTNVNVASGLASDADEGNVPTSPPLPIGCRYRIPASLPAVSDGTMAYARCRSDGTQVFDFPAVTAKATNQVTVTTTATLIVSGRPGRTAVTIIKHGAEDAFIGGSGVTTTTGAKLVGPAGTSWRLVGEDAVYAIMATGTQAFSFLEEF